MAGRIPQYFIDDLLVRTNIVEVIGSRVELKRAGSNHKGLCPFHNEKSPSFTVSESKQFYHCFGCGEHGSAIQFLMSYEHLDFVDAIEVLAQSLGLEVPREGNQELSAERNSREPLYQLLARCTDWYKSQLKQHTTAINYLKQRGLDGTIAQRFGIGYAPNHWDGLEQHLGTQPLAALATAGMLITRDNGGYYDRFRDRIMFPIRDARGRTIGFGGRIIEQGEPKYLNSPETPVFHKREEIYGLYEARQTQTKLTRLVVVEGYMDVVALAQYGIHYCVATLGTAVTEQQVQRLFRSAPEIIFCFDGDNAGRNAAWRALENTLPVLRDGVEARFLFLPQGEDPDTLVRKQGAAAFQQLLDQAIPLADYLIDKLSQDAPPTSLAGKTRFVELVKPLFKRLPDGLYADLLLEQLAKQLQISNSNLKLKLLDQAATDTPPPRPIMKPLKSTPLRLAIALLLQYPQQCHIDTLATEDLSADLPGMDLLQRLLHLKRTTTTTNTAVLLNHLSDFQQADLNKLVNWEIPGSDEPERVSQMFNDSMQNLLRETYRSQVEQLLAQGNLDSEQKAQLKILLSKSKSG